MGVYILGPWLGEFATELIMLPYLRSLKNKFLKENIVIGYSCPGRDLFYEFADRYWSLPESFVDQMASKEYFTCGGGIIDKKTYKNAGWDTPFLDEAWVSLETRINKEFGNQDITIISPCFDFGTPYTKILENRHSRFNYFLPTKRISSLFTPSYTVVQTHPSPCSFLEAFPLEPEHKLIRSPIDKGLKLNNLIVIFPRDKLSDPFRNWQNQQWEKLAQFFIDDGFQIAILGHGKDDSLNFNINHPNFYNTIGTDLATQIYFLQNAKISINPMSGATYLSTYTGTPAVVFGSGDHFQAVIKGEGMAPGTNSFGVPVFLLDTGKSWTVEAESIRDFVYQKLNYQRI